MIRKIVSFVRRALNDQRGQVLPWVAFGMVGFLGAAGLSIDVGHAYVAYDQLQGGANAAALAAASATYNSSGVTVSSQAALYGSASGGKNALTGMGTVHTTASSVCLNILKPQGTTCATDPTANAVKVTQTANIPTYFLKLFGLNSISLTTTAQAAMQGMAQPWNVAIIVDSTGSMATSDSNCGGVTEFQCALSGIQSLLQSTNPACPAGIANCPTGENFRVSLFTFPNVITTTVAHDVDCNGSPASNGRPTAAPYTLPKEGQPLLVAADGTTYMTYTQTAAPHTQWSATYQITPFLSDYYDASNVNSGRLNTNSALVKAVGYGSTGGCLTYTQGILNSGFGNTYFASSIYAAQAALVAQQNANPGSKNAIIFLSDGQANASYYSKNSAAYGTADSTNQFKQANQFPEGSATSPSEVGPNTTSYLTPATLTTGLGQKGYDTLGVNGKGIYPDWYDQCQQAIVAAQYAMNAGTTVYSVAYGPESSGCSNGWGVGATDTTLVARGSYNNPFSSVSQLLPCTTMEDIASSWSYFYSDNEQSANVNLGCVDNNHTTVALKDIFQAIAATFTNPQLIPKDAHN
jgi:Flp pilus assembly protein TadG